LDAAAEGDVLEGLVNGGCGGEFGGIWEKGALSLGCLRKMGEGRYVPPKRGIVGVGAETVAIGLEG
jgi:hypothetical protein